MGTHDGKVYIYDLMKEKILYNPFVLAEGDGMIVNDLQILTDPGYEGSDAYKYSANRLHLLSSTNDAKVRIHDLETMKLREQIDFKEAINAAALSPDKNLLAVYGDCLQADIYDRRMCKLVATLQGHEDFGFSLAWHPS